MPLAITRIRKLVVALREALLSQGPAAIEQNLPALEAAVSQLRRLQNEFAGAPQGDSSRAELTALHHELRRVAQLIAYGDALWEGWARLLGAALGYTAAGEPAPLAVAASISVRG